MRSAEIVSKVQLSKTTFLLNTVQLFSIDENSRTKKRLIFLLMPNPSIKWERSGFRTALQKGIAGILASRRFSGSQHRPGSPEGKPQRGVHQTPHDQPGNSGNYPAVLSVDVASPGVLVQFWALHVKKDVKVL